MESKTLRFKLNTYFIYMNTLCLFKYQELLGTPIKYSIITEKTLVEIGNRILENFKYVIKYVWNFKLKSKNVLWRWFFTLSVIEREKLIVLY